MDHSGARGRAVHPSLQYRRAAAAHRERRVCARRAGATLGSSVRSMGVRCCPPCFPCISQSPGSLLLRSFAICGASSPSPSIAFPSPNPSPSRAVQPVSCRTLRWKRTTLPLMQRRTRTLACGRPAGAPPLARTMLLILSMFPSVAVPADSNVARGRNFLLTASKWFGIDKTCIHCRAATFSACATRSSCPTRAAARSWSSSRR